MSVRALFDTCVWLDLAKDYRHQPVLNALEDLTKAGSINLLVPELVLAEFRRNKDRVAAAAKQSLRSHFALVRDAVNRFAPDELKGKTLEALAETDHSAVMKGGAVQGMIERVEALMTSVKPLAATDAAKCKVVDRAIGGKAPFHRSKNNTADALILEQYLECLEGSKDGRVAFVTHNTSDFSLDAGDTRIPHSDIAYQFDGARSSYWSSVVEFIRSLESDLLDNHELDFHGLDGTRALSEILEAEHLMQRQVWYNRHWNLRANIEEGRVKIVSEAKYSRKPYRQDQILDTVWTGALAAAKRTEDEVGKDNLGPWDDFEWGMINGKLSALRWVLGDEWDMLDT